MSRPWSVGYVVSLSSGNSFRFVYYLRAVVLVLCFIMFCLRVLLECGLSVWALKFSNKGSLLNYNYKHFWNPESYLIVTPVSLPVDENDSRLYEKKNNTQNIFSTFYVQFVVTRVNSNLLCWKTTNLRKDLLTLAVFWEIINCLYNIVGKHVSHFLNKEVFVVEKFVSLHCNRFSHLLYNV